jgi:hypothetical protein
LIIKLNGRACLVVTVSYEAEWNAEKARTAALEARCNQLAAELAARLATHQRQERLQLAWWVAGLLMWA